MVIAAADPLARGGLAAAVAGVPDLAVVGVAGPGDELESVVGEQRPDVVVVDAAAWADGSGEAGWSRLTCPVVALVRDPDAAAVLASGARAVLTRDAEPARLAAAVRAAADGLVVIDEALLASVLRPSPRADDLVEPLTRREREVLELLAQGLANRDIATRLAISEHTAKFHVNAIIQKLGARGRTEAVVRAAHRGLVAL